MEKSNYNLEAQKQRLLFLKMRLNSLNMSMTLLKKSFLKAKAFSTATTITTTGCVVLNSAIHDLTLENLAFSKLLLSAATVVISCSAAKLLSQKEQLENTKQMYSEIIKEIRFLVSMMPHEEVKKLNKKF